MSVHRGEVWSYRPVLQRQGQSLARVIVSADGFNDTSSPVVHSLHIVDTDPGNLLAVPLASHGWALVPSIEGTMKNRLGELQGVISLEEREAIDSALKALLELD